MTDRDYIFLSYSRRDQLAATNLCQQLERHGLSVFKDDERVHAGELWLEQVQKTVSRCTSFIVLIGNEGVQRWVGAETRAAIIRYFEPQNDAERLPIFPILLGDT